MSSSVQKCECESKSDEHRINCLVDSFVTLLTQRGLAPTKDEIAEWKNVKRLSDVKLMDMATESMSEELVESQILLTFVNEYSKRHPRFATEGPKMGDIQMKTSVFQST